VKYVTSASILALGLAILICALMPRYYLIFAFPNSPVVQMGPFATRAGCESGRHRLTEAVLGNSDPAHENERETISRFMVCVSSR
jgi:ABC-type hemin transport system ATPase subunit